MSLSSPATEAEGHGSGGPWGTTYGVLDDVRHNHFGRVVLPGTAVVRPPTIAAESLLADPSPRHGDGPLDLANHNYQRSRARFLAIRDPNHVFALSGEARQQVVGWRPEYKKQ